MPTENTTPNQGYQLPHGGNDLSVDVARIISAIASIDVDIATALSALASKAGLASPAFTGTPTAPTAAPGTDSAQLATTAFVKAALDALIGGAPGALDTLNELAAALADDAEFASTIAAAIALKADIASVVRHDVVQANSAAGQGRARANIGAGILAGFRNKIINGSFDVWQRGTSFTAAGNFIADRWFLLQWGSGGSGSIALAADNPIATAVGRRNVVTWDRTGGTTVSRLSQKIEGVETLQGKRVTVAIIGYATVDTPITVRIDQKFGTGGSPSAEVTGVPQSATLTTSPQVHKLVFDLASVSGKTVGTNKDDCVHLLIDSPASGNFNIRLIDVALVEGDASAESDPIPPRHPHEELALCQRYYEKGKVQLTCYQASNSGFEYLRPFAQIKRALPSIVFSNQFYINASGLQANGTYQEGFIANAAATSTGLVRFAGDFAANSEI